MCELLLGSHGLILVGMLQVREGADQKLYNMIDVLKEGDMR